MPNSAGVEVARISVKVSPNTKEFRRELKRDLDAIEKALRGQIEMKPDTDGFRENLQAKVDAATRGVRGRVKVDSEVDEKKTKDQANKVAAIFQKTPMFGGGGGASFGRFGGINPQGYLLIAAGITAIAPLISGLLGAVTTAILTLPGLITTLLVPIGALALGIDGIKKAAETLKGPFEELKAVMTTAVQDQFTPVFEKLKGIFPTLKSALPTVTQGMADIAQALADMVTDPKNLQTISGIIRDIGGFLTASAPGIRDFANGILDLVKGFTGNLDGISGWINTTGKSFTDWVKDFTNKGWTGTSKFDRALSTLGDTLTTLGGGIVELAGKSLDFFSDPEKVKSFKAELDGLVNSVLTLADAINGIAAAWSKIPGFSDGAGNSFLDFMPIQIQLIADGFMNLPQYAQAAFIAIPVAARAAVQGMVTAFTSVAGTISSVFANIASVASNVWSGIVAAAQGAWNGVVSAVQSAWGQIVSAVQTGVSNVLSAVGQLPGQIQAFFADAGSWLVSAGKAIIQGLINGIKSMVGAVKDAVGSVLGGIKNLIPHSPAKEGPFSGAGWKEVAAGGAALATQFGDGFESGFQSVLERAKALAGELKKAMDTGADESSVLGDMNPKDLKLYLDALEQEKKRLKILKNDLPKEDKAGRAALQNQLDQLQAQKDILSYQKDRVKNEAQYGAEAGDDPFVKAASGLMNMPVDFAKATGKQFLSDLGISGNGFISKAITEGISYVFNIGSVDEAMSIKDRQDSKQAMAIAGAR